MPKERVKHGKLFATREVSEEEAAKQGLPAGRYSEEYYPGTVVPEDSVITEEISLDVGWNRSAEWVQVSMHIPDARWEEISKLYAEDSDSPYKEIYTDVLTRKEINDMIKVLRKARDQAYGADE